MAVLEGPQLFRIDVADAVRVGERRAGRAGRREEIVAPFLRRAQLVRESSAEEGMEEGLRHDEAPAAGH